MATPYFFTSPMSAPNAKDSINIIVPPGDDMPPTPPNPPGRTLTF